MSLPCLGLQNFNEVQMATLDEAVALAEEITSNHFKYSTSQWRRSRYDVRTLRDLEGAEIIHGAFAQLIKYIGQPEGSHLGSSRFDFYKICLQDHVILHAIERDPTIKLFPLIVYVVTHELVHIVRFSTFLQAFEADPSDRVQEEKAVHSITQAILSSARVYGMEPIVAAFTDSQEIQGITLERMSIGNN